MKILNLTVNENKEIFNEYWLITLTSKKNIGPIAPGQFVNVYLPSSGNLVPRPFSIFSFTKKSITIFYKIVGEGTSLISKIRKEEEVKILAPLGNNFPLKPANNIILLAGGIGIAPILCYLEYLRGIKHLNPANITLYYGAKTKNELFFLKKIEKTGIKFIFTTDDGTFGKKGFCINEFKNDINNFEIKPTVFSCGPHPMLKALFEICTKANLPCYLSLEEVMGCGFGACMGCVTKTKPKFIDDIPYKLVCKDGPIFEIKELKW